MCLASVAIGLGEKTLFNLLVIIQWSEQFLCSDVCSQMSQSLSLFDYFLLLESSTHLSCTLVPQFKPLFTVFTVSPQHRVKEGL